MLVRYHIANKTPLINKVLFTKNIEEHFQKCAIVISHKNIISNILYKNLHRISISYWLVRTGSDFNMDLYF